MKKRVMGLFLLFVVAVLVGPAWAVNENTFLGGGAGLNTTTGWDNTFLGYEAGFTNTTSGFNTFVGHFAGVNNIAEANTFIGTQAGQANTTGASNVFLGTYAGYSTVGGPVNTFIGTDAGYLNTSGGYNVYLGTEAGYSNDSGNNNVFLGYEAGYHNLTGSNNVFIGNAAGWSETGSNKLYIENASTAQPLIYGDFNTAILTVNGRLGVGKAPATALDVNGTVTATTFAGSGSGLTNVNAAAVTNGTYTTGSYANPTWITSLAGTKITGTVANAATCTSAAQIGTNTANYIPRWNGTQLVSGIISDDGSGNAAVNGTLTMASLLSPSDERYKRNIQPLQQSLDKVTHLTGVSYEWKTEQYSGRGFKEGRQIGLIAQEVEKVLPELVHTDGKGYMAVAYDKIVPVLIEAVKEQQKEIKEKDARIERLEKALEKMERRMVALEGPAKTFALK